MALNGNVSKCSEYLMGNHTIAERMFRVTPTSMLYVPLRFVFFQVQGESTTLVIEQPSSNLASLVNPKVDAVAAELDQKLAALLRHLDVPLPAMLAMSTAR